MKIISVDLKYDYGDKNRGINQIGELGFRGSMRSLGHEVIEFNYDDYLQNPINLQKDLLSLVEENNPDLVFFCLFENQIHPETIKEINKVSKTINWFGDDQWRFNSFTKKYAPLFTYSITTDKFSIPKYKKLGIDNIIYSQWSAIQDESFKPKTQKYEFDISFIGGAHPVRKWIIHELNKRGIKIAVFGPGWPSGPVSLERMTEVFRDSKINLNLPNSNSFDARYFKYNPRNIITSMRSSKNAPQMKARNFEIPYYGGFTLTDYVPSLEEYFDIGKEIVCFKDIEDLEILINYYLENEGERELIRERGVKKAREKYTYLNKFRDIFEAIK